MTGSDESTPRVHVELPHRRTLPTVADTEAFGAQIAQQLRPGDLVVLDGPLGAGKTAVARGVGAGLGVCGRITSPTFVIAREHRPGHDGGVGLVHVDAYRLGAAGADMAAEIDALDLDTDLTAAVVLVEWGAGVVETLADRHLLIRLWRGPDTDERVVQWGWVDTAGPGAD